MLAAVWHGMYQAEKEFRQGPSQETLDRLPALIVAARKLVEAAPGTWEARQGGLYLVRCLEMAGERNRAEAEFDVYLRELAAAEGAGAACKMLCEEGEREKRVRNYEVAVKRFRTVLAFAREGERAAQAHMAIGGIYAQLGQRSLAEASTRKALGLGLPARDASRCYHYLINVAVAHKDYDQARRDAAALLQLPASGRDRARDETKVGMVLERAEGPARAMRHYQNILERYPERECRLAKACLERIQSRLEKDILAPVPQERGRQ